jgi:hypothetical protein
LKSITRANRLAGNKMASWTIMRARVLSLRSGGRTPGSEWLGGVGYGMGCRKGGTRCGPWERALKSRCGNSMGWLSARARQSEREVGSRATLRLRLGGGLRGGAGGGRRASFVARLLVAQGNSDQMSVPFGITTALALLILNVVIVCCHPGGLIDARKILHEQYGTIWARGVAWWDLRNRRGCFQASVTNCKVAFAVKICCYD